MKILLSLLITLVMFSCNDKRLTLKTDATNNARQFIAANIEELNRNVQIDSLKLLKLDSITEKKELLLVDAELIKDMEKLNHLTEKQIQRIQKYRTLESEVNLADDSIQSIKKSFNEVVNYHNKIQAKLKKSDSVIIKSYLGSFILKTINIRSKESTTDSISIPFNLDLSVQRFDSYLNNLKNK